MHSRADLSGAGFTARPGFHEFRADPCPSGGFSHGTGFGSAEPPKIFNGGDPTGLVTKIQWSGWGGPRATGTGLAEYIGPGQSVATGRQAKATVVA